MEAARSIVNTIKKHRTHMVRDVERLCDAYIILANVDASQWKAQRSKYCFIFVRWHFNGDESTRPQGLMTRKQNMIALFKKLK